MAAKDSETFTDPTLRSLRAFALTFPETTEGDSCVKRAFRAGKKNFVFLGEKDVERSVMVRLGPSVDEMTALSAKSPEQFSIGKTNWATIRFTAKKAPTKKKLEGWIEESFRMLATKTLVAAHDA